jgi:hypothetical protein
MGTHQAGFAQQRQMLGKRGLAQCDPLVKFANGEPLAKEIAQDKQALLVAERLEHTRRVANVLLHPVDA